MQHWPFDKSTVVKEYKEKIDRLSKLKDGKRARRVEFTVELKSEDKVFRILKSGFSQLSP